MPKIKDCLLIIVSKTQPQGKLNEQVHHKLFTKLYGNNTTPATGAESTLPSSLTHSYRLAARGRLNDDSSHARNVSLA